MKKRKNAAKPDKPRHDFPLFAHAGGTWAKTIDGKHEHFGPWGKPDLALKRWEEFEKARKAGRAPRPVPDGSPALADLRNLFLTHQMNRAKVGQISYGSFRNFTDCVKRFVRWAGESRQAGDLRPDDFAAYALHLAAKGFKSATFKKDGQIVRQMFKWAFGRELIDKPVNFGDDFKIEAKGSPPPEKLFAPEELRTLIDVARPPVRAAVLLGINCGFGQTDVADLPADAVDLEAGAITYHRAKTGVYRRCVLWPETVQAMRDAAAARPRALADDDDGLFFLTTRGTRFVRKVAKEVNGIVKGATVSDSLATIFARTMGRAGIWKTNNKGHATSDGRGFYTLRRTHRTWTGECLDDHAADTLMGHTRKGMGGRYVQRVDDGRLKRLTDHVRLKIWPERAEKVSPRSQPPRRK